MSPFLSDSLLIFVRHAQTEANVGGLLVGRGHSPFTDTGFAQMDAIIHKLSGVSIDRVFTSPSERTAVLARRISSAASCGDPVHDDRLQEIDFGVAEGLRYEDLPRGGVSLEDDTYSRPLVEGGESRTDVDARVASFLDDICGLTGTTVVVSHGGPLRSAVAHAIGLDPRDCWAFHVDNGVVITLSMHGRTGVLEEMVVPALV